MKIAKMSKILIIVNILVKKWIISITCARLLAQYTFSYISEGGIYWFWDILVRIHNFHQKCDFRPEIHILGEKWLFVEKRDFRDSDTKYINLT